VIRAWRQWQAPDPQRVQAELARIGSLSWREFAAALEQRYAAQGYRVTRLSGAGADFKLEKGVGVTLVSAGAGRPPTTASRRCANCWPSGMRKGPASAATSVWVASRSRPGDWHASNRCNWLLATVWRC
jgi:hypothetical protein